MAINNLQLYRGQKFDGLVDSNKLSNAFLTEPEIVNKTLSFVFGYQYSNPISLLTGGIGKTQYINNSEFRWYLAGDLERPSVIVENLESGNSTPGIGGSTFQVKLKDDQFVSGEVLIPNSREFPVIVMGDRIHDGDGFIYTLALLDGKSDPTKFMPPSLLEPGKEFSKDFSAYEEGSSRSGITTYNSPFELRNRLSIHRKHYEMTGSAATDVMIIKMKDQLSGRESFLWENVAEWTMLQQWYREIDRALVYNRFGQTPGANGRPTLTGAGLREQIAPANKREFNVNGLTENVIAEFLLDLSYNIIDQPNRKFVALCGEGFMSLFDRAMKNVIRGWTLVDTKFISGSGQDLTLGGQFTTYKGVNGIEVTLMHYPVYDDPVHNRELNPLTGRPLESYRATFIEFGQYDGQNNITKVAKSGREQLMWYNGGSTSPDGGKNSKGQFGSKYDGYQVEVLSEIGIKLHNPLSCGELIPSISAL